MSKPNHLPSQGPLGSNSEYRQSKACSRYTAKKIKVRERFKEIISEKMKDKAGAKEAYAKYLDLAPDAKNAAAIKKKIGAH